MAVRNTRDGWGWPARLLHWLVAALVFGMLVLGFGMVWLVEDLGRKFQLYQLHKSIGVLVLALMLVRLVWRRLNVTPALPATMPRWQALAARSTHAAFYVLLILQPVIGWLMAAASPLGIPTVVFGLFTLPHPIGPNETVFQALQVTHAVGAVLIVLLLVLHVGGALKHHLVDRDDVLMRMLR